MREVCLMVFAGFMALVVLGTISQISSAHMKEQAARQYAFNESQENNEFDSMENNLPYISAMSVAEVQVAGTGVPHIKFEKQIWPQIREALCPNMVPNVTLAKERLFHLARERIGFPRAYEEHLAKKQHKDDVYNRFFDFHVTIHAYTSEKASTDGNSTHNETFTMGYLPIWKCSNDQLLYSMNEVLGDRFDFKGLANLTRFFSTGLSKDTNHAPCLVTAIRDPISHFLAGYNEIDKRFGRERKNHYDTLVFSRFEDGSTERFEQFVADMLSGPNVELKSGRFNVWPLAMPHVYLMSGVLAELARNNVTLTDYLPTLHNLHENWPGFVAATCYENSFPENFVTTALNFSGHHSSLGDPYGHYSAAKTVWNEGGLTAQALCILHVMDYACFEKVPIPLLCRGVYSEDDFISAITSEDFDAIVP